MEKDCDKDSKISEIRRNNVCEWQQGNTYVRGFLDSIGHSFIVAIDKFLALILSFKATF